MSLLLQFCLLLMWPLLAAADAAPWPVAVRVERLGPVSQPAAVAVDAAGTVWALDADGRLLRWTAPGAPEAVPTEPLERPLGLSAAEGFLWVADTGHGRLLQLRLDGTTVARWPLGEPCLPPAGEDEPVCRRAEPVAVAVAGSILAWSDRALHALCRLERDTGRQVCQGGYGTTEGQFRYPFQIAVDGDGFLAVVDVLNARLQQFHPKGKRVGRLGWFGLREGDLYRPNGIAFDTGRSLAFVSDAYFGTVTVFFHGRPLGRLRDQAGSPLRFDTPAALAYRDGVLYVAETGADRIVRVALTFAERPEPAQVAPAPLARRDCLVCHLEFAPGFKAATDHAGQMPVAAFSMCYSCHHGPVIDSRRIIHAGAQHPTVYDPEEKRRRHPWPRDDELPDDFPITDDHQLTCTSCHTPHTDVDQARTLYADHHNAWLRVPNDDGRLCERCHESKAKTARERLARKRGRNHPLGIHLRPPPFEGAPGYPADPDLTHGLPEVLARAGGALGPADTLICQSCHQIHGGVSDDLLLLDDDRGELCRQCHRRQFSRSREEARRKGVHPVNVEPEEKIVIGGERLRWVTCTTCHPVHDGRLATPMLKKPAPRLCQDCHPRQHAEGRDDARRKGVHPVNVDLDEPVTVAGRRIERLDCLTCHAVHRGKPNTPALMADHRDGALCRPCHQDNLPVVGSDHDLRVTAADSRNRFDEPPRQSGVCGACHTLHRGKGKWPFLYAARIVGRPGKPAEEGDETALKRDRLCLNCHQDHPRAVAKKKVVAWFSHPAKDIVLRSDEAHMPLLDSKEEDADFGVIGCATCHDPHVWTPAHRHATAPPLAGNRDNREGDPHSSFLRELKPEKTLCLGCHGLETREKYKYFHDRIVRGVVDYLH